MLIGSKFTSIDQVHNSAKVVSVCMTLDCCACGTGKTCHGFQNATCDAACAVTFVPVYKRCRALIDINFDVHGTSQAVPHI